ncbi:MAG: PilZ domain-containing protein, partial [Planctomycetota bacterium]|nr:PilZ domain-containing protein [Planctomycetota bacterium]MDI6788642.1 PilZ domain-containing protein [Planctomycetota bacterium]
STINISAEGLLFAHKKPYPLGTEFVVSMKLGDKEYFIPAKTIRTEQRFSQKTYHIAFVFSGLSNSAQADLSKELSQMYERTKKHP